MRILPIVLVVACAFTLSACKGKGFGFGYKDVVCSASKAWINSDSSAKQRATSELSSAVQQAESSANKSSSANANIQSVIDGARQLLSNDGQQITDGTRKIQKYC